jgi:hypothetical protein
MNRTVADSAWMSNKKFALVMAIEWSIGHQSSGSSEVVLGMADRYLKWLESNP